MNADPACSLAPARLAGIVARFADTRVAVIGDVMLDHFIHGRVRRISPEAPVPVVEFASEDLMPGGAANVARNVVSLGASVALIGVVGNDAHAQPLRESLSATGIDPATLVIEPGRPTTCKTRVSAQHQQIVRIDRETARPISENSRKAVLDALRAGLSEIRIIIIADYAKGVLDQPLLDAVSEIAAKAGIPICIDPKPHRRLRFTGCRLLTPNRKEIFELAGLEDMRSPTETAPIDPWLLDAIARVHQLHTPDILLVTLSEHGMLLAERDCPLRHVPTAAREVADVSGAGDTVIASFTLALAAGATPLEATLIANHAAGVVVAKSGTAQASVAELTASFADTRT